MQYHCAILLFPDNTQIATEWTDANSSYEAQMKWTEDATLMAEAKEKIEELRDLPRVRFLKFTPREGYDS
jgi:hypothetical protein